MTQGRPPTARRVSRRQLLKVAALGSAAVVVTAALDQLAVAMPAVVEVRAPEPSPPQRRTFRSRPDLAPPVVSTARRPRAPIQSGLVLLTPGNGVAPDGPMIVTDAGEPVWVHPVPGRQAANLRVGTYQDRPVLTWWEGSIATGYGRGEYVIADRQYREITRVHAGNGLEGDLHEFLIGPDDTAYFLATRTVQATMPAPPTPPPSASPTTSPTTSPPSVPLPLGGTPNPTVAASAIPEPAATIVGPVLEGVVQRVDIASGQVLFEWHSLPAIDPSESYQPVPTDGSPYDYLHANSIELDGNGGLVVSARHTWTVYRIDMASGEISWRLNGKRSDFTLPRNAQFAWQHDARVHANGTLSLFDDGASGPPPQFESRSRGIVLALDQAAKTGRLVRSYVHPENILVMSQGSLELLPNGGAFVGWGASPRFTEFDPTGNVAIDGSFAAASQSYRSFLQPWVGRPADPPDVVVDRSALQARLWVSWNGVTGVAAWQVLDPYAEIGSPLASTPSTGFETSVAVPDGVARVVVRAVDASGLELGRSGVIALA